MLEVALDMQIQELTVFLNLGKQPERTKARLAHAWVPAPYGAYPSSDGYVIISMGDLSTLGEALDDDRLREMDDWAYGMTHRDEIHEIVSGITPRRTTQEWVDLLDSFALWSGPVYHYEDLENDPHIAETGVFVTIEHPTIGTLRTVRSPIRSERTENPLTPPPALGEHTEEVLRRVAGYDDTRIAAFLESAAR
jgi:crotonobetainyl-CoA:carnitine CoA-transferase CaiB-like acyl-CoA transferase